MANCGSKERVSKAIESWFYDAHANRFVIDFRVHGHRHGYVLEQQGDHVTQEDVEQLIALLMELDPNGFSLKACDHIMEKELPQPEPLDCLSFPPFRQEAKAILNECRIPFPVAQLFNTKDLYGKLMDFLAALDAFDREVTNFRRTADFVATDKQWLQLYGLLYSILNAVTSALIARRIDIMRLTDFKEEDAVYWDEREER